MVQQPLWYPGPSDLGMTLLLLPIASLSGEFVRPPCCACFGMTEQLSWATRLQPFLRRETKVLQFEAHVACGLLGRPWFWSRQRGGHVSGAFGLTEHGHVPAEPLTFVILDREDPSFWCGRRRGGWVSGARRLTEPGHVPTEPSPSGLLACGQIWQLHFSMRFQGIPFPQAEAVIESFHASSALLSKLTVRVRQLAMPLTIHLDGESVWEYGCHTALSLVDFHVALSGFLLGWYVFIPPCLNGGLLNTLWGASPFQPVLGHWAAFWILCVQQQLYSVCLLGWPFNWLARHPLLAASLCDGDYATFVVYIGEDGPRQLAGLFLVLQRQIRLPVAPMLYNGFSLSPVALCRSMIAGCCPTPSATSTASMVVTSEIFLSGWCRRSLLFGPVCGQNFSVLPGLRHFKVLMEQLLYEGAIGLSHILLEFLGRTGIEMMALRRSGCLIFFCYLCKLLLFGCQLKGGAHNCDNLLRMARFAVSAVPLSIGAGLRGFSPRLHATSVSPRKFGRKRAGYSMDLFILLLLASSFTQTAGAARASAPAPQPTEFPRPPAYQEAADDAQGLLQNPDIAEDYVPAPWVFQPPPEVFVTRAYKLIGFGHQPEYLSCTTRQAATAQRCLELLEPDTGAGRTGGEGALHFLRGQSVLDELQAQWMPSWVHSALGRLVTIDASLLGLAPFQTYLQDGIISYARINRIMPELEGSEYYIFVPSQDGDPLAFEGYPSRMILDHCDVVHLTPDPAPPNTVQDTQWAFDHFSDWSHTEFADGYDVPLGTARVLVLSAGENFLLPAIAGESDLELTQRICEDLGIDAATALLVRPGEPFERPMYCQHFLSDIVFLLDTPLKAQNWWCLWTRGRSYKLFLQFVFPVQ